MNQRQNTILDWVNTHGQASVAELAKHLAVSEVTIRHDLNQLEKQNYLRRIHGAAVRLLVEDVDARMKINFALKQRLAQHAASLVEDGETVFIEGGSTNALLARYLADTKRVTIVTISSYITQLLKETATDVILLGGLYQKSSETMVGPLTRMCVQQVHFSKAFIGIDGFQSGAGFTGRDMMRADVLNTVIEKNACNIIMMDSSKFGQVYPHALNPISNINQVIVDDKITPEHRQALEQSNIHIDIVAS